MMEQNAGVQGVSPCLCEFLKNACGANSMGLRFFVFPVLERAERLGLISELELQTRLTALTAFAKGAGAKSWRFRKSLL